MKLNPLLLIDYYKSTHAEQYPKGITRLVSYYTPRMSRLGDDKKLVHFGLQYFIKEYLIDGFNKNFFNRDKEEVLSEYEYYIKNTMINENDLLKRVSSLHDLGYLPIEIYSLPEGTIVPMQVPCLAITNSHKDFAWLTNTIESLLSATLWHAQISASVGMWYRNIVNQWYDETSEDDIDKSKALGDFSFRGQESLESAVISSVGFLTSFSCSATVPSGYFMEKYYGADLIKNKLVTGSVSTEHSVMCSNYAVDGDNEELMLKRLLTEIYPNTSFSIVCDSYDYWNVVDKIIPAHKNEIINHNGTMLVRGDSGVAEDIICGTKEILYFDESLGLVKILSTILKSQHSLPISKYVKIGNNYSIIRFFRNNLKNDNGMGFDIKPYKPTPPDLGTVECLWNTFGGSINSKGYKVLNSHIKAIYGDSITIQKCNEIYKRLAQKGFASSNVVLGVGSFSMQCVEENNILKPFTRDTFSSAVKSTYCEIDGEAINIYKNPKTDTGHFKKSQRGCCVVHQDGGYIQYYDECTWEQAVNSKSNMLELVFKDSKMVKEQTIEDIRNIIWNGEF